MGPKMEEEQPKQYLFYNVTRYMHCVPDVAYQPVHSLKMENSSRMRYFGNTHTPACGHWGDERETGKEHDIV